MTDDPNLQSTETVSGERREERYMYRKEWLILSFTTHQARHRLMGDGV